MDLKEFIKTTISEIVNATEELTKDMNCEIYNQTKTEIQNGISSSYRVNSIVPIDIDFDVAITATETEGAEGGGGIKVASLISIGGKVDSKVENQTISRVKFTLPLVLPNK